MTTDHTPGPWAWEDDYYGLTGNGAAVLRYDPYEGMWLAFTNTEGRQDANARLIAAAPDLLAALEDLDFCIGNGCGDASWDEACARMQAAIAKAKGV